jgi:hypothetical protein
LIARLEQANARAYEREQSAHNALPSDVLPPDVLRADGTVYETANANPAQEEPRILSSTARLDGGRMSSGRARRYRFFWGLFLVFCVGVAAICWRLSDDDVTRRKVFEWASQSVSGLSGQINLLARQTRAADESRTEFRRPESSEKGVAINASEPLELEHALQSVTREIEILKQGVEQLKASQEQTARDSAKIVELLKASQEQSARDGTKVVELLKTSQEQSTRDNVRIAEQLRSSQEQVARVLATRRNQRALTVLTRNPRNDSNR